MDTKKTYIILFLIALVAGLVFGLNRARASSPEGETSGGEPAKVWYDEFWQASEAVVSSNIGYTRVNPANRGDTGVAASWETDADGNSRVTVLPKIVVTQWTVHGHIHFE